jgi:hypothetical protein
MANIPTQVNLSPVTINKFLGLNLSNTGDTQIKLGESGNMNNFYITNDYKLRKIYGYKSFYDFETPIKGLTSAVLNKIHYLLVATDGKLYYFLSDELEDEENWDTLQAHLIGTIGTDECSFFTFDNKVYILCGKYYSWDGTTLKEVDGYVPKVYINTPPTGGGTEYEQINMLTGKKYMTFNGDGTSTVYQIAEKNVSSIYKVIVDGTEKTSETDYTVDLTNGTVTFTTAPSDNLDNVSIYWNKDNNTRKYIEKMKFGTIFGGDVDTRVFLYGNPDEQNRIRYSAPEDGIPSVEYFPTFNQLDVGPKNFAVTDLTRQYDRLLITTNKPEAYYLTLGTIQLDEERTETSVQTFPLNESHGNIAMGQGRVLNNDPVTIEDGAIIKWKSTNVRDEKNMSDISQKIKLDLIDRNLSGVKTLDYQTDNQYWVADDNRIYIYNYYNDTFSRITIAHSLTHLTDLDDVVYMSTDTGKIMKFGEQFSDFDGITINSRWEMDFYDFDTPYMRKTMKKLWVLMQPQAKASAEVGYITNKNESPVKKRIEYALVFFDDVDFADFSFQVSNNPQPFRLKLKAKKFTNLKIVIENKEKTDCTILALSLRVETGGESK